MAAPPETTEAPPPPEAGEEANNGVEVCLFDESVDGFSRTVRAISELADGEPEPDFPDAEVERLASSITFLREWRHFSYEPKGVRFTNGTESASSRDDMHSIMLPQFSSASVPQTVKQEDRRNDTVSFDIILFAGGNVWAMDWCPRFCDKPSSSINCEYLAVAAHPPGSSYHKLGMPLTGRGIIQVWCLLAPFEDAHCHRPMYACNSKRRGRPRKIPDGNNSIGIPSNPPKPRGRPRKRPIDDLEPVPKRPKGRPRKHPLPDAKLEDSPQNNESRDIILFDPLAASTAIPDGLPSDYVSVKSNPKRGRGRPKKNPCDKLTGSCGTVLKDDMCAALSPTLAICTNPKRPRGRPRKYPVPSSNVSVSGIDVETGKDATCKPVSLGCTLDLNACTESNANLSIVAVDATLPIVDKLTGSSGTVLKEGVCTALSPTSAICVTPKRPRGRPRKYPVPSSSASVPGVDIEIGKRATDQSVSFGCSLDHTGCTESNGNLSVVAVDATLPIADKLKGSPATVVQQTVHTESSIKTGIRNEPKRKRGRPRKYPVPSNVRSISGSEIEIGKDTTGQPVSFGCSLNLCPESNSNINTAAVDAASPFTSSSTATYENKSQCQRSIGQNNKRPDSDKPCSVVSGVELQSTCSRETIPNDPVVSSQNVLPSGQSNIVSGTSEVCSVSVNCQGNVHKGALSYIHISPKSSNKRESSGRRGRGRAKLNLSSGGRGRGRPRLAGTACFVASGANSPITASVPTSQVNLASLQKSDGEFVARNLGSVGSCGCDIEKCSAHLSVVTSDACAPAHGLYNTNCKEESSTKRGDGSTKKHVSIENMHFTDCNGEEQKKGTTPNSSHPVALVENCMKGSCPKKGGGQPNKISASKESAGASVGGTQTTHRFSTSMTIESSRSEAVVDEAGLIGSKTVGCVGMIENESNTANDTSHCNENAGGNQVAPSFRNTDRVIDEMEATKLVPLKESREDGNTLICVEKSSPVPKEISLPRVVLCLAHNGKVAWDIKWKPPLLCEFEQKSRLGFLAVLLGNGSLEVWEVPSPCMIQKIYSPSKVEGSDPRFLKLEPVFRCVKVKCGNRQSIPLTVDWSPSPPHDMILAGCHDGTVALWNFSTDLSSQDSKPFMCVTAESVPIRALSWAPYISEENTVTFVTAGEDGLKFWDLRDPYRPLWELTTAPRAVLSLHWLKDARGIVISLEDGTLKFLSLPRIANDVPVTGRPFVGTKTQGVSTYQLSEYLIWSIHASEATGCAAYCGADGTAVHFQLTSRFWDKEPGKNRAPYFLCGSLSEEGENIKIGGSLQTLPLPNVPLAAKKGPKPCQDIVQAQDAEKEKPQITGSGYDCAVNPEPGDDQEAVNPEPGDDQEDEHSEEQETSALVLASPTEQENDGTLSSKDGESHKDSKVIPPKSVALHRVRWNTNKGSERWLCYGGAAGIVRCQRI